MTTLKIGDKEYPVTNFEMSVDKANGPDQTAVQYYYDQKLIHTEFIVNVKPMAEGLETLMKLIANKSNSDLRNKKGSYFIREQRRKYAVKTEA